MLDQSVGKALRIAVATMMVVDLLMFGLGWQVGNPDFPERATMLTVAGLGLLAAALVGGTLIGVLIDREQRELQTT